MPKKSANIVEYIKTKIEPSPLKTYAYAELERIHDEILSQVGKGIRISRDDLEPFVKALFLSAKGEYIGIESNLPSSYFKIYPTFLSAHKKYLSGQKKTGKRILIGKSWEDIYKDALMNPVLYKKFIEWHQENNVELLWITRDKAVNLSKELGIETTDLCFWADSFAASFKANPTQTIDIKLIDQVDSSFANNRQYVARIIKEARALPVQDLEVPIFPEAVAKKWEGYVGDYRVRAETLGKILLKELADFRNFQGRILDAAAGVGHEVTFLNKNGFDVDANEIDSSFREILLEKTKKNSQKINIHHYDWREFGRHFKPVYKGIILVGDSLCMVRKGSNRKKCVKEFYKILSPGGKLIIDTRNFGLIKSTLLEGKEYLGQGVMYRADKINSTLSIVGSGLMSFDFFYPGKSHDNQIGSIAVEPLQDGEPRKY